MCEGGERVSKCRQQYCNVFIECILQGHITTPSPNPTLSLNRGLRTLAVSAAASISIHKETRSASSSAAAAVMNREEEGGYIYGVGLVKEEGLGVRISFNHVGWVLMKTTKWIGVP